MTARKERQINYELLRIIAMLMIVSLHYLSKGGLLGDPSRAKMSATGYAAWLLEAFCLVAVNVYVLISGYFGVDTPAGMSGNGNTLGRIAKTIENLETSVFLFGGDWVWRRDCRRAGG